MRILGDMWVMAADCRDGTRTQVILDADEFVCKQCRAVSDGDSFWWRAVEPPLGPLCESCANAENKEHSNPGSSLHNVIYKK